MRRRILVMLIAVLVVAAPAGTAASEHESAGGYAVTEGPSEPNRSADSFAPPPPTAKVEATDLDFGAQQLERLAGANRFATSVAASQAGWPSGARAAVVASGEDYPDALAAAGLAGTVAGPLLVTPRDRLDGDVEAELHRLSARTVYLVGDLATGIRLALTTQGFLTESISGENRYETAAAVARRAADLGADTSRVIVASGEDFADALSAGALAAGLRHPLLLTPRDGLGRWLPDRARELGASETWVVGGPGAVSEQAVAGMPGASRMAGSDRAATATAVADRARASGLDGRPVLVSGDTFADGLAGGVLAGAARRAPVLVTASPELSPALAFWLDGTAMAALTLLGGAAVLDPLTVCQLTTGHTRAWLCAEDELVRQGYHVGAVDGQVDGQTVWALYAFEKVAGLPVRGRFGDAEWSAMVARPRVHVRRPDLPPHHFEIDLARQLILVVEGGEVAHVLHTSTGKASTPTVRGTFTVYEKRNFRQPWNHMYRPVFWHRGYAFHGYPEVPLYPASHGCARMYDGDMDFLWPMIQIGDRVASY